MLLGVLASVAAAATPRFSAPVAMDTGPDPGRQVAVDLSGDGKPDLAVADGPRSISVMLGRGDGSFEKRRVFRATRDPLDIAGADVDGDSDSDLITTSSDRAGTITVLLNDGAGRFRRDLAYRANAWMLDTADVNHDGLVDLLGATARRSGLVVLLGTGAGRFALAREYPGAHAYDLDIGDLNGDGNLDAALSGHDNGGHIAIQLGNGDGTFGTATRFRTGGIDPLTVALADFNHDGRLDAAAPNYYNANVAIMLGNGDGTFAPRTRYRMDEEPDTVVVADFNSDGNPDIATGSNDGTPAVRSGRGDGTFGDPHYLSWVWGTGGAVADFNLDGWPDLAFGQTEGTFAKVFLNWTALPAPPCVVLDVTEFPLRDAKRYVGYAGCRVGRIRHRYSRTVRKNHVISARPTEGTVLPSRSRVHLVVSRGRRR